MELYHFCPIPLEKESVIKPGNWGSLMLLETVPAITERMTTYLFEYILETVRLSQYPEKASRLESAYVCAGIESAKLFQASERKIGHHCYKIEIVDSDLPIHYGSWAHITPQQGQLRTWISQAELYWSTDWQKESPQSLELLTLSPIRILEEVTL